MVWLYRYSIRHPVVVVVVAAAITAAIAPGVTRLKLRTDGHALVPTDAPPVRYDRSIRETFDIQDPIVVLIESDDPAGIFNVRTLSLVKELTAEFLQIESVRPSNLLSLATERGDRLFPGTLKFRPFLEPLPETPTQLDQLRDDLRAIELYAGTLVSRNERATAIFVGAPTGVDRTALYRRINDLVAARSDLPEKIHVIGAPVAEALLGTHILEDLGVPSSLLGHGADRGDSAGAGRWPVTFYQFRLLIGRYVGLVPVALAVMAAVFLISFRSFTAAALPLIEAGACLIVVFGLMGWFNVPVYLTIAVLPVILTAVGVADEIHIFSRYTQCFRDKPGCDPVEAVRTTMAEMASPVVKTSVTTAVGFLSFALSSIGPVRVFGVFTAVGVIFCMFWSLTVIPALLALIRPRRLAARRPTGGTGHAGATSFFERLATGVLRWRYLALGAAVVLAAATPLGLRQLVVQDSWIDGFAPDSAFYRATQTFNEQFLGTHILLVCVDTGDDLLTGELPGGAVDHRWIRFPANLVSDPESLIGRHICLRRVKETADEEETDQRPRGRDEFETRIDEVTRQGDHILVIPYPPSGSPKYALRLKENDTVRYEIRPRRLGLPDTLGRIGELEAFLAAQRRYTVGGVIGPAAYARTTNFMAQRRQEDQRRIPDDHPGVKQVWNQYKAVRGIERLRQTLDENEARALITVYMTNANFVDTAKLMNEIRRYEHAHLKPHGITLEFAGDVAVSQTLIDAIVRTQTFSLLISLVGIFAVTSALGRSLTWGAYCVLPCGLAVLVNFAVMGMMAMPLGVATSMFAGMTLGIGVDYAIHLMERYRLARGRGSPLEAALREAVKETGPAIVIDALAVGLGFGVLTLSQVPANARLGGLLAVSIAGCLAATLLLLPALVRIWPPREDEVPTSLPPPVPPHRDKPLDRPEVR